MKLIDLRHHSHSFLSFFINLCACYHHCYLCDDFAIRSSSFSLSQYNVFQCEICLYLHIKVIMVCGLNCMLMMMIGNTSSSGLSRHFDSFNQPFDALLFCTSCLIGACHEAMVAVSDIKC